MAPELQNRDSDWTLNTLFIYVKDQMSSMEQKNQQRFADQEKAVQAALAAAKEAANSALVAQQTAINKAEAGLVVWKESQNEWRGTIADIISKTAGKSAGLDMGWKILIALVGLVATLAGLIMLLKK